MYNSVYAKKVAFLLRLMPFISKEEVFAVHAGASFRQVETTESCQVKET